MLTLSNDPVGATMEMTRPAFAKATPELTNALRQVGETLRAGSLDRRLVELVWLRVSQINGCGFCLDLHARDALKVGETLQRINCLPGWAEVDLYTPREKAALAWAESLTSLQDHAPDALYAGLTAHFNEREIAELTFAAALMNAWNRVAIGLRQPVREAPLLPPQP